MSSAAQHAASRNSPAAGSPSSANASDQVVSSHLAPAQQFGSPPPEQP